MGGAEQVVVNLADQLVQYNHQVKICYLTGPVLVSPKNKEIELISLNMEKITDVLTAYLKLKKIVKFFQPDVIHSHMFHANIISRLLKLSKTDSRIICSSHSNNEGGRLRMALYRLTEPLVDLSTNVSTNAMEELIKKNGVIRDKIVCVPNGIDTIKFQFNPDIRISTRESLGVDNKILILAVGRLNTPKDYPTLFKSIALIAEERQDFIVAIVGDGPLRGELIDLAKQLNILSYIKFLGIRSDVSELMCASDIFVSSSQWEGFGLAIAEAMACERMVVATDSGGSREVLGCHGILVPPRNPEALTTGILTAMKTPIAEKVVIGDKARKHIITNYSLKSNIDSYLNIYLGKKF